MRHMHVSSKTKKFLFIIIPVIAIFSVALLLWRPWYTRRILLFHPIHGRAFSMPIRNYRSPRNWQTAANVPISWIHKRHFNHSLHQMEQTIYRLISEQYRHSPSRIMDRTPRMGTGFFSLCPHGKARLFSSGCVNSWAQDQPKPGPSSGIWLLHTVRLGRNLTVRLSAVYDSGLAHHPAYLLQHCQQDMML